MIARDRVKTVLALISISLISGCGGALENSAVRDLIPIGFAVSDAVERPAEKGDERKAVPDPGGIVAVPSHPAEGERRQTNGGPALKQAARLEKKRRGPKRPAQAQLPGNADADKKGPSGTPGRSETVLNRLVITGVRTGVYLYNWIGSGTGRDEK